MSKNSVIAKNTLFLYFRMLLLLVLGLYTSRKVLEYLGVVDYGIYDVVAGVVVLFTFFNSALTSGVQRYLNYYLGANDETALKKIFSQSIVAFAILSLIIVAAAESIGLLLLNKYMDIPADRMKAAQIVYQVAIISTVLSLMRIPFNAVIIAHERMNFYAYTSILEGVMKLGITFSLVLFDSDRLILYAVLLLGTNLVLFFVYFIFCKTKFSIVNFKRYKDKQFLKGVLTFSGWNILGSAANVVCKQGNSIMINHYFGVTVNAAVGVGNQANNSVYNFLSGFQTAFNPQIVKLYAQGEKDKVFDFVIKTSKYSFMLMFFLILPFAVNINTVLSVWLKEVPKYADTFILFLCGFTLLDSLTGPLWMLVEAEGNIKKYQIMGFVMGIGVVVLTFVSFAIGLPNYMGYLIHDVELLVFSIWRLFYLKKRTGFPMLKYVKEVYLKVAVIFVLAFVPVYLIHYVITIEVAAFFASCAASCVILFAIYWFFALSKEEKVSLINIIKNKFNKKRNVAVESVTNTDITDEHAEGLSDVTDEEKQV